MTRHPDDAVRMTLTVKLVLRALLAAPARPMYGMEIMSATGLGSGTVYPILSRLADCGWLRSEREVIDPRRAGRPARRYYQLTPAGAEQARAVEAAASGLARREGGGT